MHGNLDIGSNGGMKQKRTDRLVSLHWTEDSVYSEGKCHLFGVANVLLPTGVFCFDASVNGEHSYGFDADYTT